MITTNIQYVKGFRARFSEGDDAVEAFGTVTIDTEGGQAHVFYDDKSQVLAHIDALTELAIQFDEQTK